MEKEITIDYQPNANTLVSVTQYLLLRTPAIMFFPVFMLLLFSQDQLMGLAGVASPSAPSTNFLDSNTFKLMFVVLIWAVLYFYLIRNAKRKILQNKKAMEKQLITFNTVSFTQKGATFTNEVKWEDIYQIKETKSWILIYISKRSALPIVKADLDDNQYAGLKTLFNSLHLKKSLKQQQLYPKT